jgi:N-acetylglucosamine-6-phosphate deacetylase
VSLKAPTLLIRGQELCVLVEDGLIHAVGPVGEIDPPTGTQTIDAGDLILAPGLLDIQINGGFGRDFTYESDSIWEVGARLPAYGVTAFVPTVVTSSMAERESMLRALAGGPPPGYRGAIPLGAHFEGPFINLARSGAHDPAFLRSPLNADPDVGSWSAAGGVRMVTLAPELEGALDLIRALVARGVVVSAGHSEATHDQAVAAFDAGVTYVTHLFNAMPPLGHRDPGLAGAALADPRVTVGLIADGVHSHPAVVRMAAAAANERLSLVTDATAAMGMALGSYVLGGRDVVLDVTSVRLASDGRLAGSALTSDEALRRFRSMTGWTAADALATMTSVPARLLGLSDRGALRVGGRADLGLFTPDLEVVATLVGGAPVHGPWR